ncbi:hypothetical protein AAG570_011638 [Ranatra chinensis]|uniref:Uncharacterized protein n=1 Tax=Ranatra chinensis TaxID=642074 RepID=A0ABD0YLA5_9HEMI
MFHKNKTQETTEEGRIKNMDEPDGIDAKPEKRQKRRSSFFIRQDSDAEDEKTSAEEVPAELERQLLEKTEKLKAERQEWVKLHHSLKQKYKELKKQQDNSEGSINKEGYKQYLSKSDKEFLAKAQKSKKEHLQIMLKTKNLLDSVFVIIADCKLKYDRTRLLINKFDKACKLLEEVMCEESMESFFTTPIEFDKSCSSDDPFLCCDE